VNKRSNTTAKLRLVPKSQGGPENTPEEVSLEAKQDLSRSGEGQHLDAARQSRATPSPETRKFAGAGPAIAERSKDAKAPKPGRQPGAYVKDED
jgi:hypothetical protein